MHEEDTAIETAAATEESAAATAAVSSGAEPIQEPAGDAASGKQKGGRQSRKAEKPQEAAAGSPEPITEARIGELIRQSLADYAAQQKKAQDEAERLSTMNAQQRAEYERDAYRSELEALQRQVAVGRMQGQARQMLAERGIHVPDQLIAAIVTDSADSTKDNVEQFAAMYQDAVEAAVRERLRSQTPKTGKSAPQMTKEQILAIKDDMARVRAIQEHMELFN